MVQPAWLHLTATPYTDLLQGELQARARALNRHELCAEAAVAAPHQRLNALSRAEARTAQREVAAGLERCRIQADVEAQALAELDVGVGGVCTAPYADQLQPPGITGTLQMQSYTKVKGRARAEATCSARMTLQPHGILCGDARSSQCDVVACVLRTSTSE